MIRRPPRSTLDRSSAASDVYKRQVEQLVDRLLASSAYGEKMAVDWLDTARYADSFGSVSYTHLRAHETVLDLVCRLLLEKKNYTVL